MTMAILTALLLIVSCQASAGSCSGTSCTNQLDSEVSGNLNLLQTSYSVKARLSPNDIPANKAECFGGANIGKALPGCVPGDNCTNHGSKDAAETACISAGSQCGGISSIRSGHWEIRQSSTPSGPSVETSFVKEPCSKAGPAPLPTLMPPNDMSCADSCPPQQQEFTCEEFKKHAYEPTGCAFTCGPMIKDMGERKYCGGGGMPPMPPGGMPPVPMPPMNPEMDGIRNEINMWRFNEDKRQTNEMMREMNEEHRQHNEEMRQHPEMRGPPPCFQGCQLNPNQTSSHPTCDEIKKWTDKDGCASSCDDDTKKMVVAELCGEGPPQCASSCPINKDKKTFMCRYYGLDCRWWLRFDLRRRSQERRGCGVLRSF